MVTIINYKERNKEDGTLFFVLEITAGIEMVQSQKTGQYYATAKKAYLPSTFDQTICQQLIGTQIPGDIQKVECEPYSYTIKETGETMELTHKYQYVAEHTNQTMDSPNRNAKSNNTNYIPQELSEKQLHSVNEEFIH